MYNLEKILIINNLFKSYCAGVILSILLGTLGPFIVWRRMSYFGDTLSHSCLLGISLGYILNINQFFGIIIINLIISLILSFLEKFSKFTIDTILSIITHSSISIGIIFLFLIKKKSNIINYLFGNLISINYKEIIILFFGTIIVILLIINNWNKFLLISINQELAHVNNVKVNKMKILLNLIIAFSISISIKIVGTLIITSLLIIPSSTAQRFSYNPIQMIIYSIIISIISINIGLYISTFYKIPSNPCIVIFSLIFFILSFFLKSKN